ncbi:hypothetical protein [Streptomyces sp. NPDC093060]|uniref:hypothetical protein n=1 Tax=Streptomyces sp. NPDC093060 TaxID=3366019 RepID=UPI003813D2AF
MSPSSQNRQQSQIRVPVPAAVGVFKATHSPQHVVEATLLKDDAERELRRLRFPLSVEDMGDRETVLTEWHRADKVLAATALRPVKATEVLS